MGTRVLIVVAIACVVFAIVVAWQQFHREPPVTVAAVDTVSPEAAQLAKWASQVRAAVGEAREKFVADRFHADVPASRRQEMARRIVVHLAAAESPTPHALQQSSQGGLAATWKCTPGRDRAAELSLMFVRGEGDRLELTGIMP
jgi:hypothetical protein